MAKRGTLEHPKTMALADVLGIDDCHALGILEALWHWTARYHADGNISGTQPGILARAVRTRIDAQTLWDALLSCGWIDVDGDSCLIHDWADHADNTTKKNLANRGESFADGSTPFQKRSGKIPESVGKNNRLPEPRPEPRPKPTREGAPAALLTPTVQEASLFFGEIGGTRQEGEDFWEHFENCGWRLSGGKGARMKDWKLAANRWHRHQADFKGNGKPQADDHTDTFLDRERKRTQEMLREARGE